MDILERDWRFRLGEEFRTTFGRNLGNSLMTISLVEPNVLRCEEHHEERPEWRVKTTFEFYQLGKEAEDLHPVWFITDTSNFRLVCPLEFPYLVGYIGVKCM